MPTADPSADGCRSAAIFATVELPSAGSTSSRRLSPGRYLVGVGYMSIFSARIVNIWNSLPNSVVDACTVNAFKARLDKFWQHQLVKFDLTGTGNRSEEVIK